MHYATFAFKNNTLVHFTDGMFQDTPSKYILTPTIVGIRKYSSTSCVGMYGLGFQDSDDHVL